MSFFLANLILVLRMAAAAALAAVLLEMAEMKMTIKIIKTKRELCLLRNPIAEKKVMQFQRIN